MFNCLTLITPVFQGFGIIECDATCKTMANFYDFQEADTKNIIDIWDLLGSGEG